MKRNHYMCVGLSFRELGRSLPFFEVKYADISAYLGAKFKKMDSN